MKKIIPLIAGLFAITGLASCGNKECQHVDDNKDHKCDLCEAPMGEHADKNNDHNCDYCGAKMSEHADANNDHNCDVCGTKMSEHVDANHDHNCDVCGTKMSEHVDTNHDHNCDVCGTKVSEHADDNHDHNCDICGTKMSEHADDNHDHNCDVCGTKMSEHVDSNGDHSCDICGAKMIPHQENFVREIAEPSATRDYDERFDNMFDDFSGDIINGTTEATIAPSMLRVLVDSKVEGRPISDDASIYKMATGTYPLETYDEIGFKIRMVGNKELNYSNLVLALRGDDAWKTYKVNLADALDADGEALPALSEEFQEIRISPQQSIEDGNAEYELKDSATPSGTKVLDKILGFHLYSLDEECSAVLEISEVFITKAGEKTVLDNFGREKVNKTDSTCWWRDSTGFIVQRGINIKGKSYTVDVLKENLVLKVSGDTSKATLSDGVHTVAWADLKDVNEAPVSAAVNGGFYSLAINLAKSGLDVAPITVASENDLIIAGAFETSFEAPEPIVDYPTFDVDNMFMFDNFNRTQSGFNGNYEEAITDPQTIEAGLAYQLSYNNGDKVTIHDGALVFDATELGASDYINYKACNDEIMMDAKYMIMAVKVEDGATLDNFRVNVGGSGVVYENQWKSAEGLPVATIGQEGYEYVKAGYTWLIVDLAQSGITLGDGSMDYYYSGVGKLSIDFVGFAKDHEVEYIEVERLSGSLAAEAPYAYQGWLYSPAGSQFMVLETEGEGKIDTLRFEVPDVGTFWFHEGGIKDDAGNAISGDLTEGRVVIDLVASGFKASADVELGFHVHGGDVAGNGAISYVFSSVEVKPNTVEVERLSGSLAAEAPYAYQGWFYSPAGSQFMVLETEGEGKIDTLRFEVPDVGTFWFHEGGIKDDAGNAISGDLTEGRVVIDLVASGFKASADVELGFHVHGGDVAGNGAIAYTLSSVEPKPETQEVERLSGSLAAEAPYAYQGWLYSPAGSQFMVLETEGEGKIDTLRFEIPDVGTFWFHEGGIKDDAGNAISGDLTAGRVVIDLVASGFKASADVELGFHVHGGDVAGNGAISYKFSSVEAVPDVAEFTVLSATVADLSGYNYVGGFETCGATEAVLVASSEDGATLKSLRFEGATQKWFKDDAVIGTDGNPIPADTALSADPMSFSIDLVASELTGFVHMHAGGFDGSTGSVELTVKLVVDCSSVSYILLTVNN